MDKDVIRAINRETSQFYIKHAKEFSDTRQYAWVGWRQLTKILSGKFKQKKILRVLDIGCGNMRFEKFLESIFPDTKIECTAIDNCEKLQNVFSLKNTKIDFNNIDLVENLVIDESIFPNKMALVADYDLVVAFGILHHIPSANLREKFLLQCLQKCIPEGIFCSSFWQFENDEKIMTKAKKSTKLALKKLLNNSRNVRQNIENNTEKFSPKISNQNIDFLEENDYFLAWRDDISVFRYCHNFSDEEILKISKKLTDKSDTKLTVNFACDGKNNNLNRYLVFEK